MSEELNAAATNGVSQEDRNMGLLCVLLQFLTYFTGFGGLIAPLIVWMMKKDSSAFIDQVGKETVNFQISLIIYGFVCFLLCFVFIGLILFPLLGLAALILIVIAALKAKDGIVYRYPLCIRLIK